MGMKKYLDDYKTVVSFDEKGKQVRTYLYKGELFRMPFTASVMRKFKTIFLLMLAGAFGAHLAGGFLNNDGMRKIYVVLPYVLGFLPLFNLLRSGSRLPVEERSYRRDEIGVSYERFTNHSLFLLVAVGLCLIGEIVYLLFSAKGQIDAAEYLFLALEIIALGLGLGIFINLKRIIITKASDEEKTNAAIDAGNSGVH